MAKVLPLLLVSYISLLMLLTSLISARADEERKVYIVYMGSLPRNQQYTPSSHHVSLLQKITGQRFSEKLMVRSYKRSFNGFAAKLTPREAEQLSGMEGVVSLFPDRSYELLTTRSWDFLGFNETASRKSQSESDVIIGVIDSGIWPELATFSDKGFGPPPKKWKGACIGGSNFTCNNKVIGARYYGPPNTTRDDLGHGSHTASIAAGVSVKDTSFYGLAQGIVRGGAPSARIAAYRVCTSFDSCSATNILAAFDDAIADGVDILSLSLAFEIPVPLDKDAIAIGSFHAMAAGVLTSSAAGNSGNTFGITSSVAPWLISVAASTMDRRIIDKVILGNGKTIVGASINTFDLNGTKYPLVDFHASFKESYKGEIIANEDGDYSTGVNFDSVGNIYIARDGRDFSFIEIQPAAGVSSSDYDVVSSYLKSSKAPVATILKSEEIKDHSAPVVASFSSRGPNSVFQEIMKPDVTAPGVEILAGYSPISPIDFPDDNRTVQYIIKSGTSMSCPHVTGIAAYIKSFHPNWSPSAIKSAIMTTATPLNATTNPEGEFAYGSGQVNPIKATQPGLVYDALKEDYVKLLCRNGFDEKKLRIITGDNISCPKGGKNDSILDFNYPSLSAKVNRNTSFTLKFRRTVTNVGLANSTYKAKVFPTPEFKVKVEPEVLSFRSLNEKKSFNVTVSGKGFPENLFKSAGLVWFDGFHNVRTPIVVHTIETPGFG